MMAPLQCPSCDSYNVSAKKRIDPSTGKTLSLKSGPFLGGIIAAFGAVVGVLAVGTMLEGQIIERLVAGLMILVWWGLFGVWPVILLRRSLDAHVCQECGCAWALERGASTPKVITFAELLDNDKAKANGETAGGTT